MRPNDDDLLIIKRSNQLHEYRRAYWDSYVQQCADFVMPRYNQITNKTQPGENRRVKIYDSTAIIANERLSSGLFSYLTPPHQKWFELGAKEKSLKNIPTVKEWFNEVTRITYEELAKSNFSLEMHELYLSFGYAGTGCVYLEKGMKSELNFRNMGFGSFVFAVNGSGEVDTVFREITLSARAAIQRWGAENLSDKINNCKDKDKPFTFIHAVLPREDRKKESVTSINKPIASIYYEKETQEKVHESGYDEFPFMVPRFVKDPTETYGRSPAMSILPDIKMLNLMMLTTIKQAQKAVEPSTMIPSDGEIRRVNSAPGATFYYRPNKFQQKPEILESRSNFQVAFEMIEQKRNDIKSAFYADLFAMLIDNQDNNKTKFETQELISERDTIFAPTWGRLQQELFNPLLERSVGLLFRAGRFPEVPFELLNDNLEQRDQDNAIDFEIEYIGKLAIKIKATELIGVFNAIELLSPLIEVKPEILDVFDFDEIAKFTAERFGVANRFVKTDEEIRDRRQAIAEAQQMEQQQAMALETAKAAKGFINPMDASEGLELLSGGGVG